MAIADEDEITFWSLERVGAAIANREISSASVVEIMLDHIAEGGRPVNGFACLMADQARAAALAADKEIGRGYWRGPLHGVPVAVKDLLATSDAPTASGGVVIESPLPPGTDATAVARLRRAGAVIIGKAQMTEGAMISHHPEVAAPLNPWNPGRCAGFSSSGSGVTVAAGLAFAALGSDTGGSIRLPAVMNGVTGVKPSWGRVSRYGVFPVVDQFDVIGPLARTAGDAAILLTAIAGADPNDHTASPSPVPNYLNGIDDGISGTAIGIDWPLMEASCDVETLAMLRQVAATLASLGGKIRRITMPECDMMQIQPLVNASAAEAHAASWPARADRYGPVLADLLGQPEESAADVLRALRTMDTIRGQLDTCLADVEMILAPVLTTTTPSADWFVKQLSMEPVSVMDALRFTTVVNIGGHPAIALQAGFDNGGAPMGFQLIGGRFEEQLLFRAGRAYQRATDWHTHHPPAQP